MNGEINTLLNTVIKNDFCVGCGVCAYSTNSLLTMKLNDVGKYVPYIEKQIEIEDNSAHVLSVCPFSATSCDENEIGDKLFGQTENILKNIYTGYYLKCYAGFVESDDFRMNGSSGGIGSWLAFNLLRNNIVDGIIHVKPSTKEDKEVLFDYQISFIANSNLLKGAKSKYYPVEMSQVLKFVSDHPARYAVIGVPCFIKAIRLLSEQDKIIKKNIIFTIGLVCGHLKSTFFAKSIGWQMGIHPSKITHIDFRKKCINQNANKYIIEVKGVTDENDEAIRSLPSSQLLTTNWGHGLFKFKCCDYCDDVLAETADISIGDAWLPEYVKDSYGTNIIIVRNPLLLKIIEDNKKELKIDELSVRKVYLSQAGGFRHRREGLSYRLFLLDKNNEWRPHKRIKANSNISSRRKRIYDMRLMLREQSYIGFKKALDNDDFRAFEESMTPFIEKYNKLSSNSITKKVLAKIQSIFN